MRSSMRWQPTTVKTDMDKDTALDLALEALESDVISVEKYEAAITAIKQARALDKKAENARELGLDYEPVTTLFGSLPVYDTTPPTAQPAVPEGWKLVPIEPTDAMVDAYDQAQYNDDVRIEATNVWTSMVDAVSPVRKGV